MGTVGPVTLTELTPSRTRTWFRTIAVAEAVSWLGLLIAMLFKWVIQDDPNTGMEGGVPIMGPIHGVIFIAYVACCFLARSTFGWSVRTTLVALASSIPPFCTVVFEILADKRGLLGARQG